MSTQETSGGEEGYASCKVGRTDGETDMLAVSRSVQGRRKRAYGMHQNTSVAARSEYTKRTHLGGLGSRSETNVPGSIQGTQECPGNEEDKHAIERNTSCRRIRGGLGAHRVELGKPRDVDGDQRGLSDGDGVKYDGRRGGVDGAHSGSKRVNPAGPGDGEVNTRGSHGKFRNVVPEPPTPSKEHPRRPVKAVDPPRCCG